MYINFLLITYIKWLIKCNNMNDVEIYILTHKKFNESYDETIYKPLLNGSALLEDDFGYMRDDVGDNISHLNEYFAELTGQYWVWKNSDADIVGFCHYRRWFVKNLKFEKLTKNDIINDLNKFDIILPQKTNFHKNVKETFRIVREEFPDYGIKFEDYGILESVIKSYFPDYYQAYNEHMKAKYMYNNNMFICSKELADCYFNWIFEVIDKLKYEIDFSKYPEGNKRVFGFFTEHLLSVFVLKHQLKIKEHYQLVNERNHPIVHVINRRFPNFARLESIVFRVGSKLNFIK